MILACSGRTPKLKKLSVETAKEICRIIRDPGFGKLIISCHVSYHPYQRSMTDDGNDFSSNMRKLFIPAISKLQDVFHGLKFSSVIYKDIIAERLQKLQLNSSFL